MEKYIIITPTLCQGNIPAWFEQKEKNGEERPMVFDTFREAAIYLAEEHLETLQRHIDEVKSGDREPDEIELSPEDFISACDIDKDGVITTEDGVLYDPKTYIR